MQKARRPRLHNETPEGLRNLRRGGGGKAPLGRGGETAHIPREALLKDPDIVILDEALSSVDPKTERLVQDAMLRLMEGGRTSVIIAHRLSITRFVDEVVVVENGR